MSDPVKSAPPPEGNRTIHDQTLPNGERIVTTTLPTPAPKPRPIFRRNMADPGECAYCDEERAAGNSFFPPHDPSPNCRSGKHKHCTCDICF